MKESEEKKRVLVVDDEESFTWLVKVQLERSGPYEVREENDSSKIIETAAEFMPHIVLLDIVMPGLDGGDVEALLKDDARFKEIPVLIVSALVSSDGTPSGTAAQAGEDIMLAKPIQTEKLIDAIERKLGGIL